MNHLILSHCDNALTNVSIALPVGGNAPRSIAAKAIFLANCWQTSQKLLKGPTCTTRAAALVQDVLTLSVGKLVHLMCLHVAHANVRILAVRQRVTVNIIGPGNIENVKKKIASILCFCKMKGSV